MIKSSSLSKESSLNDIAVSLVEYAGDKKPAKYPYHDPTQNRYNAKTSKRNHSALQYGTVPGLYLIGSIVYLTVAAAGAGG